MRITDNNILGPNNVRWEQYITSGDTIINGTTYKKVTVANSTMPNSWVVVNGYQIPFGPSTYSFAYRNDILNKKVYILKSINGIETDTLWYDFNLNIGDTLNPILYSLNVGTPIIVDSIDSVEICKVYHKRFQFQPLVGATYPVYNTLIEGVGFSANFTQSDENQFSPHLLSGVPYDYTTTFYCTPTAIDEINTYVNQIELFPNPAENSLQIKISANNSFLFKNYSIIDCIGRIVFSGSISDNNIDVSMLSKGLYFLRIKDKTKNIFQGKFVKQ